MIITCNPFLKPIRFTFAQLVPRSTRISDDSSDSDLHADFRKAAAHDVPFDVLYPY